MSRWSLSRDDSSSQPVSFCRLLLDECFFAEYLFFAKFLSIVSRVECLCSALSALKSGVTFLEGGEVDLCQAGFLLASFKLEHFRSLWRHQLLLIKAVVAEFYINASQSLRQKRISCCIMYDLILLLWHKLSLAFTDRKNAILVCCKKISNLPNARVTCFPWKNWKTFLAFLAPFKLEHLRSLWRHQLWLIKAAEAEFYRNAFQKVSNMRTCICFLTQAFPSMHWKEKLNIGCKKNIIKHSHLAKCHSDWSKTIENL